MGAIIFVLVAFLAIASGIVIGVWLRKKLSDRSDPTKR